MCKTRTETLHMRATHIEKLHMDPPSGADPGFCKGAGGVQPKEVGCYTLQKRSSLLKGGVQLQQVGKNTLKRGHHLQKGWGPGPKRRGSNPTFGQKGGVWTPWTPPLDPPMS